MENKVFREKSMERVASPEQLNDYVKVASPGVWMVLISVILFLVGVCVWGIYGHLDTTVQAGAECKDGVLTCYIRESDADKVDAGMKVNVGGRDYETLNFSSEPLEILAQTDSRLLHIGGLSVGEWVYTIQAHTDLADGVYEAVITTESVSPMSFILN